MLIIDIKKEEKKNASFPDGCLYLFQLQVNKFF